MEEKMAYKPEIGKREQYEDVNGRWSDWIHLMSPDQQDGWKKRGESNPGYRRSTIDTDMPDPCGIYELGLSRYGRNPAAVYIGSSCRGKISARIKEYSSNGSHKAKNINKALSDGYNIYVRYRLSGPTSCSDDENSYLQLYDYAWNDVKNGHPREYYP